MGKYIDPVLEEARRLYKLGFAIHWLRPKSKIPVESKWTTGSRKTWRDLHESYKPGYNVGVRLGTASSIAGSFLAAIDVDVKSSERRHRVESLKAAKKIIGGLILPVVLSGRGGGSRHYYARTKEPFKTHKLATSGELVKVLMPSAGPASKRDLEKLSAKEIEAGYRIRPAWEIGLMSEGSQIVLPPSIHPDSGEAYRWKRSIEPGAEIPLLSIRSASPGDSEKESLVAKLDGFEVEPVELGWLDISDGMRAAIITGEHVTDRSAFLMKASSALISAGLNQNEVLSVLTDPTTFLGACGYEHARTTSRRRAAEWVYRYTFEKVVKEKSDPKAIFAREAKESRTLSAEEIESDTKEFAEMRDWTQDLDRTKEAKYRVSLKNLDLIFSNAIESPLFIEDTFANRIQYGADTPWGGKKDEYIQDIDMIRIKRWFADTEFKIEPPTANLHEATALVADRYRIHPVREYLESLKWDGKARIDAWIKKYCKGDAAEPYLSEISRKFILALVKRVFEPGCQWDYVLVLEGYQGKLKSTTARALVGDKWFMDNLPDLRDKDAMLNLQGKWLIELGELADVKRADYNLVKAYLTRRIDTVRVHYGRIKSDVPRQSVFIGTVNEGQYLKDPTGNRRYWPVKVGVCDVAGLRVVRDQLFAEAMHIYRTTNEILMLSPAADIQATEAQEDRRVDDESTEMTNALIGFMNSEHSKSFNFDKFHARDLMIGANAPWGAWAGKGYILNIAAHVLTRLGFEKGRTKEHRFWQKSKQFRKT